MQNEEILRHDRLERLVRSGISRRSFTGKLGLIASGAAVPKRLFPLWSDPWKSGDETYHRGAAGGVAPTPPMGWNSYDSYGAIVREEDVRAAAEYMSKHLSPFGWTYIVVDYYWYYPNGKVEDAPAIDRYGRFLPASNRFPSASGGRGFKPLADYVHSLGLKFGIHVMRGIPRAAVKANMEVLGTTAHAEDIADYKNTCTWSTAMYGVRVNENAGQAYYDSLLQLYAEWGVDYIKADDMSWADGKNPAGVTYQEPEIEAIRKAIDKSERPMVLSLSPGPTSLGNSNSVSSSANMWRISGDFWDEWKPLKEHFELCRLWASSIRPNHWPDSDIIPLGQLRVRGFSDEDWARNLPKQTRFTRDEARTLMSLWLISRSPLMFGGDLPTLDPFTFSLLTNKEALAVNQESTGNRELFVRRTQIAWAADVPESRDKYLAVFNAADEKLDKVPVPFRELALSEKCTVRDLWAGQDLGSFKSLFAPSVPSHGAGLYRITSMK